MDYPAVRFLDNHTCPRHGSGRVATHSPNVYVNSKPLARATDRVDCPGAPDFIVTGTFFVQANKHPIATIVSKTAHGGTLTEASPNVRVGGVMTGVTLGNPDAAAKACEEMAKGRRRKPDGTPNQQQQFGNCGIESSRLLMRGATGSTVKEGELFAQAVNSSNAEVKYTSTGAFNGRESGGTYASGRDALLKSNGVPVTTQKTSVADIAQASAEGKGVITSHNAGLLWNDPKALGGHAINVTGVRYDQNGNISDFITVDSGQGSCYRMVDSATFTKSLTGGPTTITDKPVWK